jgi:hypothetical protein
MRVDRNVALTHLELETMLGQNLPAVRAPELPPNVHMDLGKDPIHAG